MTGNPLRYPGGKTFLAGYVAKILDVNHLSGCEFVEPYAGSAAVSLQMLSRGLASKAVLVEKDPLIYCFWKSVVSYPDALCERVEGVEVSLETWRKFLPYRQVETPEEGKTLDLGLAGLFYNRCNYSGILMAGPLGGMKQASPYGIGCRFNRERIVSQIKAIGALADQIEVVWDDALAYLKARRRHLHESNSFVYLDPPYYQERAKGLYRFHYSQSDHLNLATTIKQCYFPWLISYDNHSFIQDLYFGRKDDIKMQWLYLDYSAQTHKEGRELLISNQELPPVERFNSVKIASSPA